MKGGFRVFDTTCQGQRRKEGDNGYSEGSDKVSELFRAMDAIEYKTKDEELSRRRPFEGIYIPLVSLFSFRS